MAGAGGSWWRPRRSSLSRLAYRLRPRCSHWRVAALMARRAQIAVLRASGPWGRELACQPEPRIAELERRLRQDSSDSGTPASREPIEAKQRRRAERRERSASRAGTAKERSPGRDPCIPGPRGSRSQPGNLEKDLDNLRERAVVRAPRTGSLLDSRKPDGDEG